MGERCVVLQLWGERIGKVVRAFSLDQGVSEQLDYMTSVPGIAKPMNKSKYVNEALEFYMNKNLSKFIEQQRDLKENLTSGIKRRQAEIEKLTLTIGGLEHDLAESLAKARSDCRCLWCRLKMRLLRSQVE